MASLAALIPTYNRSEKLKQTLIQLTRLPFDEIIIRDNASFDQTEHVVKKIQLKFPKIRYLKNTQNIGAIPNHKIILNDFVSDYGVILGDDDVLNEDFFKQLFLELKLNYDIYVPLNNAYASEHQSKMIKLFLGVQSIPGLCARKEIFNKYWPKVTQHKNIYPQIDFALSAATNNCNIKFINEKVLTEENKNLTASIRLKEQNRDDDYSFSARLIQLESYVGKDTVNALLKKGYAKEIAFTYSQLKFHETLFAIFNFTKGNISRIQPLLLIQLIVKSFYYKL